MPMLKMLRSKKTAKKIWLLLAILIIPAFCFWGFGSLLRTRQKSVFLGRVSGKQINLQEYIRNFKAIRNQYLIQLGEEQLAKLEKYLDLQTQTWERIILLAEAKHKRIRVSDKEVIDFIETYPLFQKQGKFDPQAYQEIVTYVFRSSPRTFEEQMRDNLILLKLYQEVTRGITANDEEIKNAYIQDNEQISLDYISSELKEKLESRRNQIKTLGFKRAAKKFKLNSGETGLFKRHGYLKGLGSTDIFFQAVENLGKDEISGIIQTPSGFCIVRLKKRIKPNEEQFKQEEQGFAQSVLEQKRQDYFRQFLNGLKARPDTRIVVAEPLSTNP